MPFPAELPTGGCTSLTRTFADWGDMRTICKVASVAVVFSITVTTGWAQERISAGGASDASGGRLHHRPNVDFVVPLPVAPEFYSPRTVQGAQSTATHRIEGNCPPDTWRWLEPKKIHTAQFPIATALIIRLKRDAEAGSTTADETAALGAAAERIADSFRVVFPTQDEEPHAAETGSSPSSTALQANRLRDAWKSGLEHNIAAAADHLAAAITLVDQAPLRMTITVAREQAVADCAAIEVCMAGSWSRYGHRAETVRRRPTAPIFYGPAVITISEKEEAHAVSERAIRLLAEWLQTHYAEEAIAGALLADAADPCFLAEAAQSAASKHLAARDR